MPICNIVIIKVLWKKTQEMQVDILKVDSSLRIFRNTNFLSFVL